MGECQWIAGRLVEITVLEIAAEAPSRWEERSEVHEVGDIHLHRRRRRGRGAPGGAAGARSIFPLSSSEEEEP